MPLLIFAIIYLILCCDTTTNTEAFFKFTLIATIVGMYIFYLIVLENNKKQIEISRQNTLNSVQKILEKCQ